MKSPTNVKQHHYYDVPTVKTRCGKTLPVILPSHTDGAEHCLTEVAEHYHVDFRFCELNDSAGWPAWVKSSCSPVFMKRLKVVRESFESLHFSDESAFFFVNRWFRNHAKKKLTDGKCPHKGLQVVNPCGTCPGHGLRWNLETGELADFVLPFYLELADGEVQRESNLRGVMTADDQCSIVADRDCHLDGTVIMVDSRGKRYGRWKQKISARFLKTGDEIVFKTGKLCD